LRAAEARVFPGTARTISPAEQAQASRSGSSASRFQPPIRRAIQDNIDRSVMMVTALAPVIGYDKAAAISYYAIDHDLTLKEAALARGVPEDLYGKVVIPSTSPAPAPPTCPPDREH
jgi:fumarate hydratase class II